jgi:hypothetical protein
MVLIFSLAGCNMAAKHERPRDITCEAKCSDCKDVQMTCHGISKSEDNENISVTGK